jgi:hypothetical protein
MRTAKDLGEAMGRVLAGVHLPDAAGSLPYGGAASAPPVQQWPRRESERYR